MTDPAAKPEIRDLAGGWIQERKGTTVPGFLKLAYVGFCLFALYYLFAYWFGETGHATRGPHVQAFNEAGTSPAAWWHWLLAAILALFVAGLLRFAFARRNEED